MSVTSTSSRRASVLSMYIAALSPANPPPAIITVVFFIGPIYGLVVRLHKDRDGSEREDDRENCAAVAINFLGPLGLLIVIQDGSHQDLDQGKENEQRAREKKGIKAR